ncbi:MAG: hypothetical protein VB119_04090 [Candidatus Metalachnospira sp.]|nr:hypothetical protein [Candidatus Metalachnospira sp.]
MIKKPIRNLHSDKPVPPRVFDVVIDGDRVDLEIKTEKNKYEKIPWEDVLYQVEAAKVAGIK